ncbi:MAG: YceI family protein [Chloroflexi bacterium]|nr:YceI family protein [Chloroflexota bacterium]
MFESFTRRHAAAILVLPLLAACGAQTQQQGARVATDLGVTSAQLPQAAATTVTPGAQTAAAFTAPAPASALVFQIASGQSKATFRVREQLAGRDLPSDAVGTTGAVTGQLVVQPDGTIVKDASKITVDMTSLATDSALRDNFIKRSTLQTQQYPTAEFVPTKVEGLPDPLPASGQYTFKLTGLMTIHRVQKELTWDVTAAREGAKLTGTATTAFTFGDFGMTPPRAPAVLSVVDEIRLEVSLVASQTA